MTRAKTLLLVVMAGCADEGITHIAGPYPVTAADAGRPKDAGRDAGAPEDASLPKDAGEPVVDASEPPPEEEPTGEEELPPCPTGYSCMDPAGPLAAMGLSGTITDPDGNPVMYSCAKGGQETCDPKDPKKSCPNFSEPYCVHIKLGGLLAVELDQCAQRCTP